MALELRVGEQNSLWRTQAVQRRPFTISFCQFGFPWWAGNGQVKFSGSYPSLGRNLSGCPTLTGGTCNQTVSVALIQPATMFEKRVNQLDLRLGRVFRIGNGRALPSIDLYNIFNSHAILRRNDTYGGAWGTPTQFLDGRLLKFSVQVDF